MTLAASTFKILVMPDPRPATKPAVFAAVTLMGKVSRVCISRPNIAKGTVWQVLEFRPDSNDLSKVPLEVMQAKSGSIQVEAVSVNAEALKPGHQRTFSGIFQKHVKWGWRLKVVSIAASSGEGQRDRVRNILQDVTGNNGAPLMGKERIKTLFNNFNSNWEAVLRNDPTQLRQAIPGLTIEEANRVCQEWKDRISCTPAEATERLKRIQDIGPVLAERIVAKYGRDALAVLRYDPYAVARSVAGIGFQTADRLAQEFQVQTAVRMRAMIAHAVEEAVEHGHTGLPRAAAIKAAAKGIKASGGVNQESLTPWEQLVDEQCTKMLKEKDSPLVEEDGVLWLRALVDQERTIATKLQDLANQSSKELPPLRRPPESRAKNAAGALKLSKEQKAALSQILTAPISVLTGGPGTGKTTLLAAVAAAAPECVLCAPTGRAAKRLKETTEKEASTIHRILFDRSWKMPEGGLLVIDECSMVDISTMADFMVRLGKKPLRLLLVGDADQLPSIGPGQVFRDIIESCLVPVHRLTTNFRTPGKGGGIVTAANDILQGLVPKPQEWKGGAEFALIETDTAAAATDMAVNMVRALSNGNLNPQEDIQVLVAMHRGDAGTKALNDRLRAYLNPLSAVAPEVAGFRAGDRIMNTVNRPDRGLANGDLGVVKKVNAALGELVADFGGKQVLFDSDNLSALQHAYALTVHKSQGSEYPAVVVVIAKAHSILLGPSLLYTAFTRAQRHLVVVAEKGALAGAFATGKRTYLPNRDGLRYTRLAGFLQSEAGAAEAQQPGVT